MSDGKLSKTEVICVTVIESLMVTDCIASWKNASKSSQCMEKGVSISILTYSMRIESVAVLFCATPLFVSNNPNMMNIKAFM